VRAGPALSDALVAIVVVMDESVVLLAG
jgi:hypothetical protein